MIIALHNTRILPTYRTFEWQNRINAQLEMCDVNLLCMICIIRCA